MVMADGSRLIDMLCALGAISLGYGLNQQVMGNRTDGVLSLPHVSEVEAGEAVLQHVAPWASWVKFTKTGSEATHCAYRVAKKVTGRDLVVRFEGSYHGWHEWCDKADMWPVGSVPIVDYAAIFVEPHRWQPIDAEWLHRLRLFCDETGTLLVFDSMIWGGRMHLQGTSGYFGVEPDLETFGKAYGNGQSVAFVTGKAATYDAAQVASGTYSGDVTGMQAICDTLHTYTTEPVIEHLWARGRQLQAGLDALVAGREDVFREGLPVHQRLRFINNEQGHRFSAEMANRGVLWHPEVVNFMYAHTPSHIDQVLDAAEQSLKALA